MRFKRELVAGFLGVVLLAGMVIPGPARDAEAKVTKNETSGFVIEHELLLPVSPDEAYDAMTGDVSGWWDHTFAESPALLYIDARPGGQFVEVFDDTGDGVVHATVTYAHHGKLLRYEGPLGLAGSAFTMSMTFVFEAKDDGTLIKFTGVSMGVMEPEWAEAVDGVWHHFLAERLKPYVEAGEHKNRKNTRGR